MIVKWKRFTKKELIISLNTRIKIIQKEFMNGFININGWWDNGKQ